MTIYDYIREQESKYAKPIELEEGWNWNMKEHLRRSFLYLNSQFEENNDDRYLRPNKNIVLPILNIQYRTEGFDVKDIELYVDDPKEYYKSFLVRKFHNKWALENDIDTFIDDVVEEYCNYGGTLVRKTDKSRPEVIDLRSLAFCNQTDLINHPFGIRHVFSASELRDKKKWDNVDKLITLADNEEIDEIEVFEVHGELPTKWLDQEETEETEEVEDTPQIQIVAFYMDENENEQGLTLFSNKEPKLPFKMLKRDDKSLRDRALGRGGVEELFEPQAWTNWNEIKITEMLDSASKTIHWSDDPKFKTNNNLSNVENNEVLNLQQGNRVQQLDTAPRDLAVFNDSLDRFEQHAQVIGSAEGLSGEEPSSGTPFKLFEARQIQAESTHKYRQGKIATFMDELYRDWIIPHITKELTKDQTFLSELSFDEVVEISEKIARNKTNKMVIEKILEGEIITREEIEAFRELAKEEFASKGNKKFITILKDEIDNKTLSVMTNIAGKQKNLALLTDKVVNVLRQYISTPQIRQDPEMAKLLNTILESSGLSPIMFNPAPKQLIQPQQAPQGATQPLEQLAQANQ